MTSKRFIEVPADALIAEINLIGEAVAKSGGVHLELEDSGKEIVHALRPPRSHAEVRIYTSIARGAKAARGCGDDAIRLFWGARVGKPVRDFKPMCKAVRVFRTAPKGEPAARLEAFLKRFRGAVREVYRAALRAPSCPLCHAPMVERQSRVDSLGGRVTRPFLGCAAYPECKGTRRVGIDFADTLIHGEGDEYYRGSPTGRTVDINKPEGTRRNMRRSVAPVFRDSCYTAAELAQLPPGHRAVAQYGLPHGEMALQQVEDGLANEAQEGGAFFATAETFEGGSAFAAAIIAGDRNRKGRRG